MTTHVLEVAAGSGRALRRRSLLRCASAGAIASGAAALAGCGARVPFPQPALPQYAYRSAAVREGYTFATASTENRAALETIPCYCSCVALGHTSLRSCFLKDSGKFDSHAAGCAVCIDETLDVKRLLAAGAPLAAIRRVIDEKYAGTGKPTLTPPPPA